MLSLLAYCWNNQGPESDLFVYILNIEIAKKYSYISMLFIFFCSHFQEREKHPWCKRWWPRGRGAGAWSGSSWELQDDLEAHSPSFDAHHDCTPPHFRIWLLLRRGNGQPEADRSRCSEGANRHALHPHDSSQDTHHPFPHKVQRLVIFIFNYVKKSKS